VTVTDAPPKLDCPRCGAPLRPDQDWCLNCGTAVTTEVAGAPGWRTPVAIVAVVLLIAAGALVFAFLEISDDAERQAQAPTPTPAATTAPPASTPAPTESSTPVPTPPVTAPSATPEPGASPTPTTAPESTATTWPAGREAWTVVLFSSARKAEADAKAKDFAGQGKTVGVLDSDEYTSLRPGYWVVFSGQYETQEEAQSAAEGFGDSAPGAYARKVTPK
jgi:sporulation related protein